MKFMIYSFHCKIDSLKLKIIKNVNSIQANHGNFHKKVINAILSCNIHMCKTSKKNKDYYYRKNKI